LKNNFNHIVISSSLIALLVFSQVGVNFLHSRHDEYSSPGKPAKHVTVQRHGTHCKVCSMDVFNHAFVSETIIFFFVFAGQNNLQSRDAKASGLPLLHSKGRAPPMTIS